MEAILEDYFSRSFKAIDLLFAALEDHYVNKSFDVPTASNFKACCAVSSDSVSYSYLYKQKVGLIRICLMLTLYLMLIEILF